MSNMIVLSVYAAVAGLAIFTIATFWKIFEKAGQPGWAALVPVYNVYTLTKVAKVSPWMTILMFVPLIGMVANWMVADGLAKKFGKGFEYTLGLFLLSPIFYPVLAFSSAKYIRSTPPKSPSTQPMKKAA